MKDLRRTRGQNAAQRAWRAKLRAITLQVVAALGTAETEFPGNLEPWNVEVLGGRRVTAHFYCRWCRSACLHCSLDLISLPSASHTCSRPNNKAIVRV